MKLFYVTIMDDAEEYIEVVVANSQKQAEQRVSNMDCWDCLMFVSATEIDIVDGFKAKLESVDDKLNHLRGLAKEKTFYNLSIEERVEYMNKNVFNYDDSNIPYKTRGEVIEELNQQEM